MTSHSSFDYFEQEFKVGDRVVYPVRQSSSMWLVDGTVVELGKDRIKVQADNQKPAWLSVLNRVVIYIHA